MGRIGAPFGIKGWIKVQPFTEALDGLLDYDVWHIGQHENWQDFEVEDAAVHGDALVAKLVGVDDRDQAFAVCGREIAVYREDLPETSEDEFYWNDLIGLRVVNRDGVELGNVAGLRETGSHDTLVVNGDRERMIPFADAYVLRVDLLGRQIEVDWELDW
jgi:16S rRNA processing protein RimM